MFFENRLKSIRATDRVLEVGPGASPYFRSNEFLEYDFVGGDVISQRGDVVAPPDFGGRKVTRYSGEKFPFADNQFDYVIASHVIEHVDNPSNFVREVCRVSGGRGYIEFPQPPYEYLYDFDVWWDKVLGVIRYKSKKQLDFDINSPITSQLRAGLERGWDDVVANNLDFFFCGFEFLNGLQACAADDFNSYDNRWTTSGHSLSRRVARKVQNALSRFD